MANKYTFKTFLKQLKEYLIVTITDLANKELQNEEKKAQLDRVITEFLISVIAGAKIGWFTKWMIEKLVLPHISELTQFAYDLLKEKIKGVTK